MTYTPEQQKENRKLWIQELRSGKYQQGQGHLESDYGGSVCCLGVLSKIAGCERRIVTAGSSTYIEYDGNDTLAPERAMQFVGLSDCEGSFNTESGTQDECTLWGLNDNLRCTFEEIADFIETNPKGLFKE